MYKFKFISGAIVWGLLILAFIILCIAFIYENYFKGGD